MDAKLTFGKVSGITWEILVLSSKTLIVQISQVSADVDIWLFLLFPATLIYYFFLFLSFFLSLKSLSKDYPLDCLPMFIYWWQHAALLLNLMAFALLFILAVCHISVAFHLSKGSLHRCTNRAISPYCGPNHFIIRLGAYPTAYYMGTGQQRKKLQLRNVSDITEILLW